MNTLTEPMREIIENYSAGAVATVNEDGSPAVSPKATFVVVNDSRIAFGNIRSPQTVENVQARPKVEVNFIDVLSRKAVRIAGHATVVDKESPAGKILIPCFRDKWKPYLDVMLNFVSISITRAELILSPAYDLGHQAAELRRVNLDKLIRLTGK